MSDSSVEGYVLAESLRPGARIEGLPLAVTKIERYAVPTASEEQPALWTTVEFEFPAEAAPRVADALAEALADGPWYSDFALGDEKTVVFARRVFRYRRGDSCARAEVEAYARAQGVPAPQIDWSE